MRVLRILIGRDYRLNVCSPRDRCSPAATAQIAEGKQKYAFYCASCHGA